MDKWRVASHDGVISVDIYATTSNDPIGYAYHYKGQRIHGTNGLHPFIQGSISEVFPPHRSVLDLGAGSGAMSLLLWDKEFRVTYADIVERELHSAWDSAFSYYQSQ